MKNFKKNGGAYESRPFATVDVPFVTRPAARPRLGRNGRAYNPEKYRVAKESMRDFIELVLLSEPDLGGRMPLECCEVRVYFVGWLQVGKSNACDGDNMLKTVLDSLVQAGVIADDRLSRVPRASFEFVPHDGQPFTRVEILELEYIPRPKVLQWK